MTKLFLFLFVLILVGCGKDSAPGHPLRHEAEEEDENADGSVSIEMSQPPDVVIPENALALDFSCEEVHQFSDGPGILKDEKNILSSGKAYSWKADGRTFFYEISSDGMSVSLTKTKARKLSATQLSVVIESSVWDLEEEIWEKVDSLIEQVQESQGESFVVLSNKVNGQEQSFPWTIEEVIVSETVSQEIKRHTNPWDFNKDGRNYLEVTSICTFEEK